LWQLEGQLWNALPVTHLKIEYGGQETNYTNVVVGPIGNVLPTSKVGFDPDTCIFSNIYYDTEIKIGGLQLYQPFYYAVSYINSSNEISPHIKESRCAYTVTNNSDVKIKSPSNLQK
jgi:hypothetical protein